jgi:hypothetical protein
MIEQSVVGTLPPLVGRRFSRMPDRAKAPRFYVRRAPRQHEPVEKFRESRHFCRGKTKRNLHRFAARFLDCTKIFLGMLPAAMPFFHGSSPGYADPGTPISPGFHCGVS